MGEGGDEHPRSQEKERKKNTLVDLNGHGQFVRPKTEKKKKAEEGEALRKGDFVSTSERKGEGKMAASSNRGPERESGRTFSARKEEGKGLGIRREGGPIPFSAKRNGNASSNEEKIPLLFNRGEGGGGKGIASQSDHISVHLSEGKRGKYALLSRDSLERKEEACRHVPAWGRGEGYE